MATGGWRWDLAIAAPLQPGFMTTWKRLSRMLSAMITALPICTWESVTAFFGGTVLRKEMATGSIVMKKGVCTPEQRIAACSTTKIPMGMDTRGDSQPRVLIATSKYELKADTVNVSQRPTGTYEPLTVLQTNQLRRVSSGICIILLYLNKTTL